MGALSIIRAMDRMRGNPDSTWLEEVLQNAERRGVLDFSVFVCPKFNTSALQSNTTPETYMPTSAEDPNDLFFQRISKLRELVRDFDTIGVKPRLHILIGDNDAQVYIFPFMPGLRVNTRDFNMRRGTYLDSFKRRVSVLFGNTADVQSLGLKRVVPKGKLPEISAAEYQKELTFFGWLFGSTGPYKGNLRFTNTELQQMVSLKFALYGAQGEFLQKIGGILLQTEGPGVWLQRTRMLRCTGARAVPAIYPWIRKEEA